MNQNVEIKGARIHNLRNIDVTIPKNKLTVITGVSGSGKSSLAFDTLYEEGRKRYLMFSGTQLMVESEISVDDIRALRLPAWSWRGDGGCACFLCGTRFGNRGGITACEAGGAGNRTQKLGDHLGG